MGDAAELSSSSVVDADTREDLRGYFYRLILLTLHVIVLLKLLYLLSPAALQ